ncbi:MAG TPA: hypothetical protein VJP39_05785 [Gaiellaceae bacterium]|nr:hypothetical protein [Gaiellaceae bacterium]
MITTDVSAIRKLGTAIGRTATVCVIAILAVWVAWTWPWAPLVWLTALLVVVAVYLARAERSR